jgi:hypothetical protein
LAESDSNTDGQRLARENVRQGTSRGMNPVRENKESESTVGGTFARDRIGSFT